MVEKLKSGDIITEKWVGNVVDGINNAVTKEELAKILAGLKEETRPQGPVIRDSEATTEMFETLDPRSRIAASEKPKE